MTLGFSDTQFGVIPLPFDLTPFGMPSCNLLAARAREREPWGAVGRAIAVARFDF